MTCGYQGYEFGARYLDSVCIDGRLFDADDCDEEGNLYEKDYKPCPGCVPLAAMDQYADDWLDSLDCRWPRWTAWHLVMDIRRNRGLKTIPFLVFLAHRLRTELFTLDRDWFFRFKRLFV